MPKSKSRRKKQPKRVLALPDLEQAKMAVLNSLTSARGQRTYDHAMPSSSPGTVRSPRLAFKNAPSCSDTARYTGDGASGRHPRPRKGLRPPRHRSCHCQDDLFSCPGERTTGAFWLCDRHSRERSSS
jgi:hypothetical protein